MHIRARFLVVVLIVASLFGVAVANNITQTVEGIRRDYSEMKQIDARVADEIMCGIWFGIFQGLFSDTEIHRFNVVFNTTEFTVSHARFVMSSFFMSYAPSALKMLYDDNDPNVQTCLEERITSYVNNMME